MKAPLNFPMPSKQQDNKCHSGLEPESRNKNGFLPSQNDKIWQLLFRKSICIKLPLAIVLSSNIIYQQRGRLLMSHQRYANLVG